MSSSRERREWTANQVMEHLLRLIEESDRRYEERFRAQEDASRNALAATEKAVSVAEVSAERWRSNANEWRAAMTDREAKFVQSSVFMELKERLDRTEGGGKGMRDMWGWLSAAIILVVAVLGFASKFYQKETPQLIYVPAPAAAQPSTQK